MNLQETLKYMEAQIPLKEGQLDKQFRTLKASLQKQNPNLDDAQLDNQVAQKLVDSGQFPGMDAQAILNTIKNNQSMQQGISAYDKEMNQQKKAGNDYYSNLAKQHKEEYINNTQKSEIKSIPQSNLQQYYQDMKTGEDLKNSIDSFNNQLSQQIINFEILKGTLMELSKQYKAQGQQTQNLDTTLANTDKSLAEIKQNDSNSKNIFKGIGNFLKGALNTIAGVAGNFIGGIAAGMGAAK